MSHRDETLLQQLRLSVYKSVRVLIVWLSLQVLKNQRNDPLLVATNASNTPDNPTLVLRFPPGIPSVSLR